MSKRIATFETDNGTIVTTTKGAPEGSLPNFDAAIMSPPASRKQATNMEINLEGVTVKLTGRQFRTLARLCRAHEDAVDSGVY